MDGGRDDDPRAPIDPDGVTRPDDLPEPEFQALVGRWNPMPPDDVAELLAGAPFGWWIVGGWALEFAGAAPRPHLDTDVAFLLRDLPALRRFLSDWHLWAPTPDRLRPVLPGTHLLDDEEQLWARRDAASPWVLDLVGTPSRGDDWVFKKDHRITRPLAEVGHATEAGIPYLAPEVALLHKAPLDRPKDRDDLASLAPVMEDEAVAWLRASIATCWPGHAWLALL